MIRRIFAVVIILSLSILFVFYTNYSLINRDLNRTIVKKIQVNSLKYLVDSWKCKILDVDPFDPPAMQHSWYEEYIPCTTKKLLTYVTKNHNITTLHIDPKALPQYRYENISCCYSKISWNKLYEPDLHVTYSPCVFFEQNVTIDDDIIQVDCKSSQQENLVYSNTHAQITTKKHVVEKLKNMKNKDTAFSVLIVGIDSMSRLNFIRSLPDSYKFLMDNDWISFKGYNKIADNTFPNIMAMMTGYNEEDSFEKCLLNSTHGLIKCPMIWYDYRNLGYVTSYAEDETRLSTFNLNKKGFAEPPTDYYFRSYFLASENLKVRMWKNMSFCAGPESSGERVLNIAKDFASTFVDDPSFGLFWMNTFSRNDMNAPSMMDDKIKQFLQDITNRNVLERSIVIFLSDHGMRFGNFRSSSMGWLEERLPFFFLWIPHQFRRAFRHEYLNILENANHKLTSPYDLYMTLQHLLVLSGSDYQVKQSVACPKCKSLFYQIDDNRSCEDAAIDQYWCACIGSTPVGQNDQLIKSASLFIIEKIHDMIHSRRGDYICARYFLHKIVAAGVSERFSDKYVQVVFETVPKAVFESALLYKQNETQKFKLESDISRIDTYGKRRHCSVDSVLQKYCFCETGSFAKNEPRT